MILVEREAAVSKLRSSIDARGSLVMVSGEAGAGKTVLVREVVDDAVWGYCEPLSTPRPLGPFRDLERQLLPGEAPAAGVGEMGERLLRWLQDSTLPLVIEDAHWLDDASADVLRFLGRRIAATAGSIIVTFRDEVGVDHPLRRVLGDLAGGQRLIRIDLDPMSLGGVTRLVEGTTIDPDEAYRLTSGNPFLLTELIMSDDIGVVAPVRDAVAARVNRLPSDVRKLVELLSVIPGRVDASVLGEDWAQLDEAAAAALLRVDGAVVEFRHELVRLAVEAELSPSRRRTLHAEVLARLTVLGAEPAQLAFHAQHAHETEVAYRNECAAGARAVEAGSHREAADHFRRAVLDADRFASPTEQALLWLELSREEYLLGRDDASIAAAEQAVAWQPQSTAPAERGRALRWLSRVTPSASSSLALARSAVELLEPLGPSPELAAALAHLATDRMLARDLDAAIEWARPALAMATELGERETEVIALQALGAALTLGAREPDCAHLRLAVELASAAGLDAELGRAYSNLVSAAGEERLYDVSAAATEQALPYFIDHDVDAHATYTRAWSARCLFEQGRWADATTRVDEILELGPPPSAIAAITAWTVRGRIRVRRGDPDSGGPLDRAKEIADRTGSLQRLAPVAAARAEARWLSGEADDGSSGLAGSYELALERANRWAIGELGLWMWRHGLLADLGDSAAEPYRLQVNGESPAAGRAWLALGCPYEAADAWTDSGDEGLIRDALAIFTDLGAVPGRQRAARRLRELGVRSIPRGPRDSTTRNADGLTVREVEVLHWVRGGYTDSEIAQRLHLSIKTVGHHVSAVLRKTGSRTRRELQQYTDVGGEK